MGQLGLAVLILIADVQAAGLGVAQIGTAANLKVFLLAGAPGLDVAALDLQVSLSYQVMLSSGLQTTIISCFSNWWIR